MTDIVRAELADGVPMSFGGLWAIVEKAGGNKFALKSALNKGRERGEFHFNGELYSSKPFRAKSKGVPKKEKKAQKRKKPLPVVVTRKGSNPALEARDKMTDGVSATS